MQFSEIVEIFFKGLQEQIRTAVREELSAAANQRKEKELMNFNETIQFLGISRSTLNNWKAKDKIPFKRCGRRIFFNKKEVLAALQDAGSYNKLKELK